MHRVLYSYEVESVMHDIVAIINTMRLFIINNNYWNADYAKIDLDSLLIQLKPVVSDKWYDLGKAIGTEQELLDKCTQLQPDQRLAEILNNWLLNSYHKQPTWNDLAEALTEIGLHQLAFDVKSVYETGMYNR